MCVFSPIVTLSGKKDHTKSRRRKLKETGQADSDGEEEMDTNSEQDVSKWKQ